MAVTVERKGAAMARYRVSVFSTEYAGGICWEWNASSRDAAIADALKWADEEFEGEYEVYGPELVSGESR